MNKKLKLEPDRTKDEKHRFRFGLKALLVAMTLICILLAVLAQPLEEARRQRRLLAEALKLGVKFSMAGSLRRDASVARSILAMVDSSYDRFWLYRIDCSGTDLTDDELAWLVQIQQIAELDLSNTKVSDDGLLHLQRLEFLSKLDLCGTSITDQGVSHLSSMTSLDSLRVVQSEVTYTSLEQLDAVLPLAHFCEQRAIEELKAAGIQVVDFPRFIDTPPHFSAVIRAGSEAVEVVVGMNRALTLTGQDVLHLGYLQSLRELTMHTVTLGTEGLTHLKPIAKLKTISVYVTNLTDKDLESLSHQTQLENLTLYGCNGITDEGLAHIKSLVNLHKLSVESCSGITAEAMTELARALPNCQCDYSKY